MRLVLVALTLLLGAVAAPPQAAAAAPRPTGQVDRVVEVVGALRRELLAGSRPGAADGRPDPASQLLIRSSLAVTGTRRPVRVLVVTYRSLAGRRCVAVVFQRRGDRARAPTCLPPCREVICVHVYRGGPLPARTRILVGLADPSVDRIAVVPAAGRAARLYRVSKARIGAPPDAPVLVRLPGVRLVRAYSRADEVAEVRFSR